MDTLTGNDYSLIANHEIAEVRQQLTHKQKGLFSRLPFGPDEVITEFGAATTSAGPSYLTIQTGVKKHITLLPEYLQYINHSCNPNVFFDTTTMQLIALINILPGEEFTFFYPSTEWKMAQPFQCFCGHANCIREIRGAYSLSPEIIGQYRLTDFIKNQLALKAARKKVA
jgi:hypothetical protein